MRRLVIAVLLLASTAARADDRRGQGFVVDIHGGGGVLHDQGTGPAITYGAGLGFALDRAGSFAIGIELDGINGWTRRSRRDRGAAMVVLSLWLPRGVSLRFGGGSPVGPEAIGDSFAGFGRVGYELVPWNRSALVVSLDVSEDTTAGPQVAVLLGVDIFSHAKSMDLSPNRGP